MKITGTASIVYEEEPTLSICISVDEDGDFYRLVQPTTQDQD